MVEKLKVALAVALGLGVVIGAMMISCSIIQNFPEPDNPEWAENQKKLLSSVCVFNNLAGFISGPSTVGVADTSCPV